jgi:hypothetical protein
MTARKLRKGVNWQAALEKKGVIQRGVKMDWV